MLRVEHECEVMTEHEDIVYLPIHSIYLRILNIIRRCLMASTSNPSAQKYLRSRVAIVAEKRRHLRNYQYIIHPYSLFRHCWNIVMILIIMLLLLTVPFYVAFKSQERLYYWTVIKNVLLVFCWMDIALNFMTGYFDKMNHVVVMAPKKIWKKYIQHSTCVADVLGSLITDVVYFKLDNYKFLCEVLSLIIAFRLFSLNSYINKIADAYNTPPMVHKMSIMLLWVLLALHWQTCLYWIISLVWTSVHEVQRPYDNSWMHELNLWEESLFRQYTAGLIRSVYVFMVAGCLHTKPKLGHDLIIVICLYFTGYILFAKLVSHVFMHYRNINPRFRYIEALAQVQYFMQRRQLSLLQQQRIVAYYEYRFQGLYFREMEIMRTLSLQMRQEIRMHACRKLVENVTFFSNLPLALLSRIVAMLKSEVFLTNDVIVRANQVGDCMYFIATGTVAIYTVTGKEVCHLEDGAHFGEIALVMPDSRRVASVIAVEISEIYRLDRTDFARTIHPYPMLWEGIKKIAIERHEKTIILDSP